MANNCGNSLEITGPPEDILKFKAEAGLEYKDGEYHYKSDFSLQKLVPVPPGQHPADVWGSKWDIETTLYHDEPGKLTCNYDSAWSPQILGLTEVSKLYPTLTFDLFYDEPGNGFWGTAIIHNGKAMDNYREYEDGYCTSCGSSQSVGPPEQECWECYDINTIVTEKKYESLVKSGVIKDLRKEGE